jgi:predicted nucleotidyltransferase
MIPVKSENDIQAIDQALNTEKLTLKLVLYIVDKIVREIQPEKIILFGSYARCDFNRDSDLDLFIVVEDGRESSLLISRKIDALLCGRRFPVDLVVRKEKGRYPGDLPFESITDQDAKEAIEAADKIENYS